jgi:hypothetical protein
MKCPSCEFESSDTDGQILNDLDYIMEVHISGHLSERERIKVAMKILFERIILEDEVLLSVLLEELEVIVYGACASTKSPVRCEEESFSQNSFGQDSAIAGSLGGSNPPTSNKYKHDPLNSQCRCGRCKKVKK